MRQDNTFDTGNIMTEMLLASEIKGFVPHPEWFFERDDAEHRRGLDLLMMTQGWRRFKWQDMATEGTWKESQPAEQSQIIMGSVNKYYMENVNSISGRRGKKYQEGKLRHDVLVLAKVAPFDYSQHEARGMTTTHKGRFKLELPLVYGDYELFVAANDSSKLKKMDKEVVAVNELRDIKSLKWRKRFAEIAKYYVKLDFPYPRFVKPYTYYQTNIQQSVEWADTSAIESGVLREVTIRSRHNGLRYIDLHKPLYVLDAYEAGNVAMDAGLVSHLYHTTPMAYGIIRNYIGDMGIYRTYDVHLYYDSVVVESRIHSDKRKSYYNNMIAPSDRYKYEDLQYIDKIYLYSDYSPRREGDKKFTQGNQPSVAISLHRTENWIARPTYRNRRYFLHGFAYQEDFYHPDYKRNPPKEGQKDYRRTLYWNPDLQFDEQGKAHVTLFNNSQRTRIQVEANGMTGEGGFLYNK